MIKSHNIPKELKVLNQWVCYKAKKEDGKINKIMISPLSGKFAKSNDSSTWSDFKTALQYMNQKKMDGLAFVLTKGIVFIDLDKIISDENVIGDIAVKLLNELPKTYAELSVSGKGIHILCYGELPQGSLKRNDEKGIEMYDTKRFVCVTGDVIDKRKTILDYSSFIADINEKYIGKKTINKHCKNFTASMSDWDLIARIRASKQGSKFNSLFSGDISGYPSHSNADYAFVMMLSFWTRDRYQIDSIVRISGLYRDKWDRSIGNSTYGELTISNALNESFRYIKKPEMEM